MALYVERNEKLVSGVIRAAELPDEGREAVE